MNSDTSYRSAEILAYYTDVLLKKNSSKVCLDSGTFKYTFIPQAEEEKHNQDRVLKAVNIPPFFF
jgi:hypothetical protein